MNLFYLHSASLQVCSLSYFPTCFTISGTESHGHKTVIICGYSHTNFSRQICSLRNSAAVDSFCDMTPNSIPRNILRLQGSLHPRRPTGSYPTESWRLQHYVPSKSRDPIAQRRSHSPEEQKVISSTSLDNKHVQLQSSDTFSSSAYTVSTSGLGDADPGGRAVYAWNWHLSLAGIVGSNPAGDTDGFFL